jgi:hypothetical protein
VTCSYCATELPPGALFCGECGRPVSSKAARSAAKAGVARTATVAAEPIVELVEPAVPVVEAPPGPGPEPEPEPEPESEPEVVAAEAVVDATPPPEPAPEPEVVDVSASAERCAQCEAELAASDIFCGECGFVRQRAGGRSRPSDTAQLDPFPWGLPVEPVPRASAPAPQPEPVAAAPDYSDLDETRIVDRTARGERFVLQFSTGESVSVSGTGLVGRNPISEPGEYFDNLVTIVDPGKSVSKTHLEFGQDAGAFWISDRFSGNGTVVREPDGLPKRCDAGKRYRILRGSRVDIGEQFFIVS